MTPVSAKHSAQTCSVPDPGSRPITRYLSICAPYLLALLFFGLALYGVNRTDIVDTDAARHAMNGAFLYDLIRTGHLLHPITYAKAYYSQLPALSMPFHPPLFPSIEAIFFALFGVSLLTARVTVAVAVAISAILFYRLALATVKRPIIAACITLTTF
jgi:4-amino-4-deoxy-L-arabinose transferase-like glycosyltransferase